MESADLSGIWHIHGDSGLHCRECGYTNLSARVQREGRPGRRHSDGLCAGAGYCDPSGRLVLGTVRHQARLPRFAWPVCRGVDSVRLSPSLPFLVAFRALQGLGGGMLGPLGISLLFGAFAEKERGVAFGLYGIPLIVAPASGPVLGGYFVQYLDWRYIFFINIPVGIAGILLGSFWLRESRRGTAARLDIPGVLLSTISFGTLLYAIQRGGSDGWTSQRILILLGVGIAAFIAFVIVELRVKEPLLDLRLFLRRTYAFANIVGWVSSIALFGAEFLLPIYLQTLRGRTPLEAGLLVLPLAISAGIVTPLAGALYNKVGGRWLIAFGSILLAI